MSKTTLRKALKDMDCEELTELIMDLYEARKEAKEYLDFFVEPNIEARLTKARTAISKEASRVSRGRARPRLTKVKQFIKDITSLNPGAEPEVEIMTYTVEKFCEIGSHNWIKDATQKSLAKLMHDTLVHADRNGLLNIALPRIEKAVKDIDNNKFYSRDFKALLGDTLSDTVESL